MRTNNFTQQTNVLDVDKHMMAYIEENMRLRKGTSDEPNASDGPADPYAELFKITDRYKLNAEKGQRLCLAHDGVGDVLDSTTGLDLSPPEIVKM